MKIILLKDVSGVGQRGQVKDVTDGYGLNHLIPNGLAEQATPEKIKQHAAAQEKDQAAREQERQAMTANVQSLENARVEVSVRATEKGGLFKSFGASDIHKAIKEQQHIDLPHDAIELEKPIKEIGEHRIEIKIAGAKAGLIIVIKRSS
jgi:large subunit ribosomal protein L9